LPERGLTGGTLAFAVTGFVIPEKCSDQLCVDVGRDHSKSFRLGAALREGVEEISPRTSTVENGGLVRQRNKSCDAPGTKSYTARATTTNIAGSGSTIADARVSPLEPPRARTMLDSTGD
jgi:hypothetical protein